MNDMMKRIFLCFTFACLTVISVTARDLVVTMNDGTRYAYPLSSQSTVNLIMGQEEFTLNGKAYQLSDVKELRIFKQAPDDAIVVDVESIEEKSNITPAKVYDLSGREVGSGKNNSRGTNSIKLRPGVYIINHQKVTVQ